MNRIMFRAPLAQFAFLFVMLLSASRAMATALPINGNVSGTLTGPAQTYTVVLPSDGDLTVSTVTANSLYTLTSIIDSNGTSTITSFYTSWGSTNSITVYHLAGATYYVTVAIYTGSGGYTLSDTPCTAGRGE